MRTLRPSSKSARGSSHPTLPALIRNDLGYVIAIIVAPLLFALPGLLHLINANPVLVLGGLTSHVAPGVLPGYAYIDPNVGFTTQALGHLDAEDLLHGIMPWWNPYSGIGLPLAGELQSAPFLPLTLLLAIGGGTGVLLEHALLQAIAGLGTFLFLRQIRLHRLIALTGGLLFAFNGTFAWFADNPTMVIAFVPWVLLGVEIAIDRASNGLPCRWQTLAISVALLLIAGFPETAYIALLLAALWGILRLTQLRPSALPPALAALTLGAAIGLGISLVALWPFVQALPREYLGLHSGAAANAAMPPSSLYQMLLMPYLSGPIFADFHLPQYFILVWSNIGGYITPLLLGLAGYGLVRKFDRLQVALTLFTIVCIGRAVGIQPFLTLFNLLPEATRVAAYRYANPVWELALLVVAMRGLDAVGKRSPRHRWAIAGVIGLYGVIAFVAIAHFQIVLKPLLDISSTRTWLLASIVIALATSVCLLLALAITPSRVRAPVVATLLVINALGFFALPLLSNPRAGLIDNGLVSYLKGHLGNYRAFELDGPFQPNYGAYYGIQDAGFNYLPLPNNIVEWLSGHIETSFSTSPVTFNGANLPQPNAIPWPQSLIENMESYEALGIRDVITPAGVDPLQGNLSFPQEETPSQAITLTPGASIVLRATAPLSQDSLTITEVGIEVAASAKPPLGSLHATLCSMTACRTGILPTTHSTAVGAIDYLPLSAPLSHASGAPLSLRLTWEPIGNMPLALASSPRTPSGTLYPFHVYSSQATDPVVALSVTIPGAIAYRDGHYDVWALQAAKPVIGVSQGCRLIRHSLYTASTRCPEATGTLIFRELSFPGWHATVNGHTAVELPGFAPFQAVAIPAGRATVHFSYVPPDELFAEIATIISTLLLVVGWLIEARSTRRSKTGDGSHSRAPTTV